ncbi:MAG: iron ABC transporter permease [Eubacteriales bacterium]|nr:iron ABC transporter permease [Eubacteriales bacterium]MDD4324425.1 iron ABC transporter permease [Eubacteriales bacterium]MDD4540561.1 iron ABC transporter permease [Eubacteriales bacterium]
MKVKSSNNYRSVISVLIIALIFLLLISLVLGRYPLSLLEIGRLFLSRITDVEQTWTDSSEAIFFNVRLPRIGLAALVGAALSVSGACYQGMFRNPLVSSDIIGASSGAAFGAALGILLGVGGGLISISAFIFSALAVALVYMISRILRQNQVLGLVLSGIMIGSIFNAGTSFLKLIADPNDQLPQITFWLMGSLNGKTLDELYYGAILILIGLLPLMGLRWKMNLLTMDEKEAQSMGVAVGPLRLIVIVCATLLTATSIAVSGMIGWISLVIPHFSRLLVGSDFRRLLPTSMLMGACFLLIVDNISRLAYTAEIPLGILTSLVGAPFYLYLLLSRRTRMNI